MNQFCMPDSRGYGFLMKPSVRNILLGLALLSLALGICWLVSRNTRQINVRKPPQVAEYSIRASYGRLLDMFENAFTRKSPLFTLPMYYQLASYKGADVTIDPFEQNRQKQVVGLIRTNFLKRF